MHLTAAVGGVTNGFAVWVAGAVAWTCAVIVWWLAGIRIRQLRDLRYGAAGKAFTERDRDRATSRLRDRTPW